VRRFRQISLRTLVALPLLAGIGLILFDRFWVYDQSTSGTELVDISVVDPGGAPVVGAVLRSSDAKMEPKPKTTNADGVVAFAHSYSYERFTSLLRDRYSHLSDHTITISAPGFKTATIAVESYRLGKDGNYGLPYPIVVQLVRPATTEK
jgi:hypothetical protein